MTLLEVKNLDVSFRVGPHIVPAVRGVNLSVSQGETLAVVGESGSGKSVTAASILRLLVDLIAVASVHSRWLVR